MPPRCRRVSSSRRPKGPTCRTVPISPELGATIQDSRSPPIRTEGARSACGTLPSTGASRTATGCSGPRRRGSRRDRRWTCRRGWRPARSSPRHHGAEEHLVQGGRIGEHRKHEFGVSRGVGGGRGLAGPAGDEVVDRGSASGSRRGGRARLRGVGRPSGAHRPETDEGDAAQASGCRDLDELSPPAKGGNDIIRPDRADLRGLHEGRRRRRPRLGVRPRGHRRARARRMGRGVARLAHARGLRSRPGSRAAAHRRGPAPGRAPLADR